jgi:hypothetical protein
LSGLQRLVRTQAERYHKTTRKTVRETRFYSTSLKPNAARLNRAIRQHWGIASPRPELKRLAVARSPARTQSSAAAIESHTPHLVAKLGIIV